MKSTTRKFWILLHFLSGVSFPQLGLRLENIPWHLALGLRVKADFFVLIFVFSTVLLTLLIFGGLSMSAFLRELVLVILFLSPFFYRRYEILGFSSVSRKLYMFFFLLAIAQITPYVSDILDAVLKIFVSRYDTTLRAQLIQSEPARAGFFFLMLHIIAFGFRERLRFDIILIVTQLCISSVTGLLLTFLFFIFKFLIMNFSKKVYFAVFICCGLSFVVATSEHWASTNKVFYLVSNVFNFDMLGQLIDYAVDHSGGRVRRIQESVGSFGLFIDPGKFSSDYLDTRNMLVPVSAPLHFVNLYGVLFFISAFVYSAYKASIFRLRYELAFFVLVAIIYCPPGLNLISVAMVVTALRNVRSDLVKK